MAVIRNAESLNVLNIKGGPDAESIDHMSTTAFVKVTISWV
jgi:hypothetical protein